MAYSAAKLITKSYYLSGIVSRELETVSGGQMSDGFDLLNDLLADKNYDTGLIPFFSEYEFDFEAGEEKYSVPNLMYSETATFAIGNVRYPIYFTGRKAFQGSARVNGVQALSAYARAERVLNGCDVYFYPLPNSDYPCKIWGKFGLEELESVDDDLSEVYERGYLNYMRYKLADFMCAENQIIMQPEAREQLKIYENAVTNISPPDLTVSRISMFGRSYPSSMDGSWFPQENGWYPS